MYLLFETGISDSSAIFSETLGSGSTVQQADVACWTVGFNTMSKEILLQLTHGPGVNTADKQDISSDMKGFKLGSQFSLRTQRWESLSSRFQTNDID